MEKKIHFNLLKRLFIAAFVVLGLVACEKDDEGVVAKAKLLLETESVEVSNAGGVYTVEMLSNLPWQVKTDSEWITFPETSGDKGKTLLSFTAAESDDDERSGVITIWTTDNLKKEILVVQDAGNTDHIFVKKDGSGDGFSWDSPVSLSKALTMAVNGNTIHIVEGTYTPTNTVTGGNPDDEGGKTFELRSNITLIGGYPADATEGAEPDYTKYPTVLDGGGTSYHVVTITAPKMEGFKTVLKGLTITNGNAAEEKSALEINGIDYRRYHGGGIIIGNAVVDIIDTKIINNKSRKAVGGLYAFGGAVVTMKRCKVNHNIANGNGGGVWIAESTAYIYDSEVSYNEGGTAPGVHGYPDAKVYMYNSVIAGNKGSSFGAAFYIRENTVGVLVNCVISGNSSTSTHGGGGVMMYNNNEVTLISTTITDNVIAGPGGGVFRQKGTNTLNIYNSIISGNQQEDDSRPEVDAKSDDAPAPVVQSSIIGSIAYDAIGEEIDGANFTIGTMLEKQGEVPIYVPIGEENPAKEYGMAAEELIELGSSLDPTVGEEIMTVDLLGNSRDGLNIMGAFVDRD